MSHEVKAVQTPAAARKRRFDCNGEPPLAPTLDDAVAERALTHKSSGPKAVHSGAFEQGDSLDKLDNVPPTVKAKK